MTNLKADPRIETRQRFGFTPRFLNWAVSTGQNRSYRWISLKVVTQQNLFWYAHIADA